MQLKRYVAPARATRQGKRTPSIEPGTRNANGQVVIGMAGLAGDDLPGQKLYELRCSACGHAYLVPGIRVDGRKCPACGGGKPGAPPPAERQPTLFD